MTIDATFWVAISFFIFFGGLVYLKIPNKINNTLNDQINEIKKELENAENLKMEAKNLLSDYENNIDKSKKETQEIIKLAKQNSERIVLEKTKKFYQLADDKKKNIEQKITQMKDQALRDIKNASVKISVEAVEHILKNSIDKNKLEKIYSKNLQQTKTILKNTRT